MSQVLKTLKKDKNIEWKYVNGKLTPFRKGKELKIGTRPKELAGAVGKDLSNAFRDFGNLLKIPSGLAKNPNIKDYVKEKYSPTDKSPEANAWRELVKENKKTQAENEAKLEGLRIDRRSGNNIRTGTRNWLNPARTPEYERDAKLRKKAEADTKKYQEDKFEKERAAMWAEHDTQENRERGISTGSGLTEWTTDQGVDEAGKLTEKVDPIKTKKTSSKKSGGGSSSGTSGELGREEWLKKTANSPAAKAFGKGKKADDLRWAAQQKYRKFKRDNNRGRLGIGLFGL